MGHLHVWVEGGLFDEQGGVDDGYLVLGCSISHQRKRGLATHQSYFDVDSVDQELILQKQIHVETTHHVDQGTACYVISSSHEPVVRSGSVGQFDGVHATSRVLVPQLVRQLRRLGVESVTQQCFYVGSIRVRVGRRGHERTVQGDVDLTSQRMQPVVHRSDGFGPDEIVSVDLRHFHLHV